MAPPSIAHYKITATLGEGGMGVVYRATDTKLNREVAIKVLTGELTTLTREAQLLAALNHPNIAAVYGVEENALVLELVEGPTLAGPLPFHEALPLISQLIDAIEYAHEKGIVHRDLKPANIKLTPDGKIKVLDFGLAKIAESQRSTDATLTIGNSQSGVIMGTPAYMAPEQARGKQVDKRADIWSFGVIVFELLTGRRLFDADNIGDSLAQTLTKPIPFHLAPTQAQTLLKRTLDRDPKTRLRDIGDARTYLAEPEPEPAQIPSAKQTKLPWLLAAAFALSTIAAILLRPAPAPAPVLRTTLEHTSGYLLSPDGNYLLHTGLLRDASEPMEIRRLDDVSDHAVPGTEGGRFPFWAPDSSAFGFHANGQIKIHTITTGETHTLAPASSFTGGSLRGSASAGDIVFTSDRKVFHLPIANPVPRELPLSLPAGSSVHRPAWLPEGDGFVFLLATSTQLRDTALYRASLSSSAPIKLLETGNRVTFARHPRTGTWHIFFMKFRESGFGGPYLTAPINPQTGELKSAPQQLLPNVSPVGNTRVANADVANNGFLWFKSTSAATPIWKLRWFERSGHLVASPGEPASIHGFSLSPDQSRAALLSGSAKVDITILDLTSGRSTRFSSSASDVNDPVWSPDGKWIYYPAIPGNGKPTEIIRHAADGTSPPENIATLPGDRSGILAITPDSRYLLVSLDGGLDLLDLQNSPPLKPVVVIPRSPRFRLSGLRSRFAVSPDGKWLLVGGEGPHVGYFIPWPVKAGNEPVIHPIANFDLRFAFFRPDGREICGIHVTQPGTVACQAITETSGVPRLSEPASQFSATTPVRSYANIGAFSRDGSKILLLSTDRPEQYASQLLTDWTTLLKPAP